MDGPLAQRIHRENAERTLLASFVAGLNRVPGRQVRYANTHTIAQALIIAFSVQEPEKQGTFNESFFLPVSTTQSGYYHVYPVGLKYGEYECNSDVKFQCI